MKILGIETSCDETSAAIVTDQREILSNIIHSQNEHQEYGGVVPEIAARAHLQYITPILEQALHEANCQMEDIDAIAATTGPGLIGGVMVGMMAGKAMAASYDKPFIAINHLEGHALTPRLSDDVPFPYLLLLASGGHTQILIVKGVGDYQRLGTTIDDAMGEAFDKTAKILGLGYPGGPALQNMAATCQDPERALNNYPLPRPMKGKKNCHFSFSGLKTSVRRHIDALPDGPIDADIAADICYAFQIAVGDIVQDRLKRAITEYQECLAPNQQGHLVVAGGVAANTHLRTVMKSLSESYDLEFTAPPIRICSDNGAMIAWAGVEHFKLGHSNPLDCKARPRWPLDPDAPPAIGAGIKA